MIVKNWQQVKLNNSVLKLLKAVDSLQKKTKITGDIIAVYLSVTNLNVLSLQVFWSCISVSTFLVKVEGVEE